MMIIFILITSFHVGSDVFFSFCCSDQDDMPNEGSRKLARDSVPGTISVI